MRVGFVALVIQHAKRMRYNSYSWPLHLYQVFPHNLINGTLFEKMSLKKKVLIFFYQFCPKYFSLQEEFSEIF